MTRVLRRWRNASRTFTPIFVTGAMGSGTTLLAFEIARRFQVAGIADESPLRIGRRCFLHIDPIAAHPTVRSFAESIATRPDWNVECAVGSLQDLYRSEAVGPGRFVVDKAANVHLVRIEFLARCFPEAPILVIFRDPVANIEGFRRKWETFRRDPLAESIRFYQQIHREFLRQAAGLGGRVRVISYEAMIANPRSTLDQIGDELGLEASRAGTALEDLPNVPGQGLRNVRGGQIEIVDDANARSYAALSEPEIDQIRSSLGPLHQELERLAVDA